MYSKFYDYMNPLFHHIHHGEEACKRYGDVKPKHEHYFFPKQYNQHLGNMPVSYFGFDPSVTRDEVRRRLEDFTKCDGRITELSRAWRIELDTGAGLLRQRAVRTGARGEIDGTASIEILDGLTEGARVLAGRLGPVRDGTPAVLR